MVRRVASTSGVIVENASHAEILSQCTVSGVNGDVMANARAPAVVVSKRSTVSATVHHLGTVAITVSVNASSTAVVASKNAHQIVRILGMCLNTLFEDYSAKGKKNNNSIFWLMFYYKFN